MFVKNHYSSDFLRGMANSRKYIKHRDQIRSVVFAMQRWSINQISKNLDRSIASVKRWVKDYNDHSLNGILEKQRKPRITRFAKELADQLVERICKGPTQKDKTTSFTIEDIRNILQDEFNVIYSISSTNNLVKNLGLSYTKPRPLHPKTDKEKQKIWLQRSLPLF